MPPRQFPLRSPAILIAHRGASVQERANTSEAFRLALRLGATGLWADVRRTADGRAVIHAGPTSGWRRRALGALPGGEMPDGILGVDELFEIAGSTEMFLDIGDDGAASAVFAALERHLNANVWLVHSSLEVLADWRQESERVRLVHADRLRRLDGGAERHAANLRDRSIDALAMHQSDWSAGLTTLMHRFGRLALATDADHVRIATVLLDDGVDAVMGPHVERLVDAASAR